MKPAGYLGHGQALAELWLVRGGDREIDNEASSVPFLPSGGVALNTCERRRTPFTQLVEGPGLHIRLNITTACRIATGLTLSNPSLTRLQDVFPEECSSHRNLPTFHPGVLKEAITHSM